MFKKIIIIIICYRVGPSDAKNLKQTNKKTDPDIVMIIRPHVYNEEEQVTA